MGKTTKKSGVNWVFWKNQSGVKWERRKKSDTPRYWISKHCLQRYIAVHIALHIALHTALYVALYVAPWRHMWSYVRRYVRRCVALHSTI